MKLSHDQFHELYRQHQAHIRTLIFRMNGHAHLDDLVQEVFVKIYTKRHQFDQRSSLRTWMYRIVINTVKDHWKKQSTKKWLQFFSQEDMPEAVIDARQEKKILHVEEMEILLSVLSSKQRQVVALYAFEDCSIREIAEILNIPEGTVKSRLHSSEIVLRKQKDKENHG
ncbi:MAG: RNA polymerase sigma factor [Bdellovibrionota bacterium]